MNEIQWTEDVLQLVNPFFEWVEAHGGQVMCGSVSSSLQRMTEALEQSDVEHMHEGYEAVCYLRSLASQGGFTEVACFFDGIIDTFAVWFALQAGW